MAQNKPDPREMARQAAKLVGTKLDQRKEAERNAANKPQTAAAAAGGAKADPNSRPKGATGTPKKEPPLEDIEHQLAKEYKEYSVAEFFKKNRQMLGYSGKVRSLTTIIHEYV